MKTALVLAALGFAGTAMADVDIQAGDLQVGHTFTLGQASNFGDRATPGASYSNVDTFSGQAFAHGGSANQAGNTITRMVMDDISFVLPYLAGQSITQVKFSVANLNTVAVSARARIRFWFADGAGGGPGTYYNQPAAVGFTFNAISFGTGVTVLTGNLAANSFFQPAAGQTLWAGLTFDNNVGATGATAAQLDNLGQGIFGPPVVGSSADAMFQTTAAGSFFGTANPAGAISNFGAAGPVANFGWEFNVPTPGSIALLGMGGLLAARRRRA